MDNSAHPLVDRRHRARLPRPDVPPMMASWVESYELWLTGNGMKPNTVRIYTDAVMRLAGYWHQRAGLDDWAKITQPDVLTHMTWLLETYARGYANNQYRAMSGFFKWLEAEEGVPNPMVGTKQPSLDDKTVPVLSDEELRRLISSVENPQKATFESRRDAAIIRLLAGTGIRVAECAGLDLADVNLKAREALVTGKGGKQRTVKFDAKCVVALDRYMKRERPKHRQATTFRQLWLGTRNRGPMTADGIGQMIERRGKAVGVHVYPHMFRHTFSHRWLDAGGAEGDLMELNGWESPEMLRRYGASARSARARRAYDRIDVMKGL